MKVENLNTVLFNPLFTSNLILFFLSGTKNNKIKTELIYLVLPILYNDKLRVKLSKCKSSSSLKTFLSDDDIQIALLNLSQQAKDYYKITNTSIITLSNYSNIQISDFIKISQKSILNYNFEKDQILREYYKSAYYLGLIFSKEDYKTIFYKF
ncbi:three component ABC system middle component [Flavobacterium sp.]|uniref:three component ABC system middle component n=1 Tax=Flavobacterium sp. TaxID=239 RepID=UPI0022BFE3CF|nr:three component ABC system middle component [Flavobacterium sp.]MCZ8090290.1 DUF6521 family protein [Flavobacterium sp.]